MKKANVPMNNQPYVLVVAGVFSMLIALLHIALVVRPRMYRYFGADQLADLHETGSSFTVFVTVGLAAMFAAWGVYALSGGGLLVQLPWLKTVLMVIGTIYVLRGLMLPADIIKAVQGAAPFRFIVLSLGSLMIGVLHMYGSLGRTLP